MGESDKFVADLQILPFIFDTVLFPDKDIKIKSFTDPTQTYLVNIQKQFCTCPDYTKHRAHFAYGDMRRFCKHLTNAIAKTKEPISIPNNIEMVFNSCKISKRGIGMAEWLECKSGKKLFFITKRNESPWLNIYTMRADYGYNMEERRWSYDRRPHDYQLIYQAINQITGLDIKNKIVDTPKNTRAERHLGYQTFNKNPTTIDIISKNNEIPLYPPESKVDKEVYVAVITLVAFLLMLLYFQK